METPGVICMLIAFMQPIILIVGLVKPQWVMPLKSIKKKRAVIFVVTIILFFISSAIGGYYITDTSSIDTSLKKQPSETEDTSLDTIITIPPQFLDSVLASLYKETFDSLYNKLLEIDNLDAAYYSRKSIHEEIQKCLFDDWWNLMERIDSTRQNLPISRKEYEKSSKKYDKQYTRFLLYGDEDIETVEFWAEAEAKRILAKLAVDPESLVIESVSCNGKTKSGYKCTVVYRAKNGFGGYVREYVTLIMTYDVERSLYKCINIL